MLALSAFSCNVEKSWIDKDNVRQKAKNAAGITELANDAVAYATREGSRYFVADTLHDQAMKARFSKYGYRYDKVTVTFQGQDTCVFCDNLDSTVIFRTLTLRGIIETVYDFAVNKRTFKDDGPYGATVVFHHVSGRIYYRRQPFPMM